jgi:TRAP-type C4-dicarboxylate transport system substrate-binding protein
MLFEVVNTMKNLMPEHADEHHSVEWATTRPIVSGLGGVISSGHPLVSMAGMCILFSGGYAFDAAAAAGFAAAVIEPTASCTLCGECVATLHDARSDRTVALSGQGPAPVLATIADARRMMAAVRLGRLRRPSTVNRLLVSLSAPSADGTHRSRSPWRFVSLVFLIVSFALWPNSAPLAQERVLRFHHILPEKSPQQRKIFLPWSKNIAEASNGRLRISVEAGMRLGGKANELLSQVESKYVDIAWILAAYSPGRFPRLEVFELPFIASSRASVTSQALFEYYETYARDELSNVHVLNVWCHPSGVILNQEEPILRPSDAAGRVMRVPSDVIGELFRNIGATPRIATVTQVLALLKQREIAGTVLPYEVIPTLKLTSEIRHITEFAGHRGLYTAVFLLVMNKSVYASLDEDLRRVLDAHSGAVIAAEWGRFFDEFEEDGRDDFTAAGGIIKFVKNEDYEEWVQASQPAIESWIAKVGRAGIDGARLISSAKQLVAKYAMMARP